MAIYSVHVRRQGLDPDRDMVLIKEGFSWSAMIFTVIWALWNKLWLNTIVITMLLISTGVLGHALHLEPEFTGVVHMAIAIIFGYMANDLRRARLDRLGFEEVDLVYASSPLNAESRFFDRHPAIAASFAEGLA